MLTSETFRRTQIRSGFPCSALTVLLWEFSLVRESMIWWQARGMSVGSIELGKVASTHNMECCEMDSLFVRFCEEGKFLQRLDALLAYQHLWSTVLVLVPTIFSVRPRICGMYDSLPTIRNRPQNFTFSSTCVNAMGYSCDGTM